MPKDFLNDYATTAAANTDIGGVNIDENVMVISATNNALREQMSHLAGFKAEFEVGADLTAQTVLAAGTTAGLFHNVTAAGTPSITSFDTATNDTSHMKLLHFNATAKLVHSSALLLPSQSTIQANTRDRFLFAEKTPGNWECMMIQRDADVFLTGDLNLNGNNIDFPTTVNVSDCLDEDDMTSNSATSLATQQSIKAYADTVGYSTGDVIFAFSTTRTGFLQINGDTLGDTGSGATFTGAAYNALYNHLWDNLADTEAPVSSGRGASAQADFDAGKTITMPDFRGRSQIGAGSGAGLTSRTVGDTGGGETVGLSSAAENASHSHTQRSRTSVGGTGGVPDNATPNNTNAGSTASSGSGTAHDNMQPWGAIYWFIKL